MADLGRAESETYYATPTLMRAARGAYAGSIRAQLHEAGLDDLPRNGAFILSGIADAAGAPARTCPATWASPSRRSASSSTSWPPAATWSAIPIPATAAGSAWS